MAGHKMPQRTKRRLIAAATAAVALIGTGVIIGVTGDASAKDSGVTNTASQQCLPDNETPPASSSTAPPTDTATQPPDSSSEPAPPPDSSSEQAPPPESSSEQAPPPETAPEQPAEPEQPAQQPEQPQGNMPAGHMHHAGSTYPAAAVQPVQPADPNASAKTAPDESGAKPPATPDPQPQAQDVKEFKAPNCADQFGPSPSDFVNIRKVRPTAGLDPRPGRNASRGTFSSRCGTNRNGHNNPDNFIVAPGVRNGAHHTHDYVGNLSADGNSTNDSLAASGTTCSNGDLSTYYWPIIRIRDRRTDAKGDAENPHNIGTPVRPSSATILFRGNAQSKVVAMPRFMRDITGDAKAAINGGANANAKWTCTRFTNRITDKYPICPRGSQLQRILDFASCWDGTNIDSANHRAHVVFPDKSGACPAGTKAVPQLRITLTYNLPRNALFALDAFPEVLHSPITDHGDFVNVMPEQLMNRAVNCINSGRNC